MTSAILPATGKGTGTLLMSSTCTQLSLSKTCCLTQYATCWRCRILQFQYTNARKYLAYTGSNVGVLYDFDDFVWKKNFFILIYKKTICDGKAVFSVAITSLQCHMIFQKSFQYADLVLNKNSCITFLQDSFMNRNFKRTAFFLLRSFVA